MASRLPNADKRLSLCLAPSTKPFTEPLKRPSRLTNQHIAEPCSIMPSQDAVLVDFDTLMDVQRPQQDHSPLSCIECSGNYSAPIRRISFS